MNSQVRKWRMVPRLVVLVLALALSVVAAPSPCAAQGKSQPSAKPGLKASIGPIAHAMALEKPTLASKPSGQTAAPPPKPASKPFIKSPAGILSLVAVAVGTGYAVYSANRDRIPPTGR